MGRTYLISGVRGRGSRGDAGVRVSVVSVCESVIVVVRGLMCESVKRGMEMCASCRRGVCECVSVCVVSVSVQVVCVCASSGVSVSVRVRATEVSACEIVHK